jgi:hypothetical protein
MLTYCETLELTIWKNSQASSVNESVQPVLPSIEKRKYDRKDNIIQEGCNGYDTGERRRMVYMRRLKVRLASHQPWRLLQGI